MVATPIGNLGDLAPRAREVLSECALIAAEDTRHTGVLLRHFGIQTAMLSLHDHNELQRTPELIAKLESGAHFCSIQIVSGKPASTCPNTGEEVGRDGSGRHCYD